MILSCNSRIWGYNTYSVIDNLGNILYIFIGLLFGFSCKIMLSFTIDGNPKMKKIYRKLDKYFDINWMIRFLTQFYLQIGICALFNFRDMGLDQFHLNSQYSYCLFFRIICFSIPIVGHL